MSENGTQKRKGSVLDLFLIGLVLLSIFGWLLHRYVNTETAVAENLQARIVLRSYALPSTVYECLSEGEPLYTEGGDLFGRILTLKRTDAKIELQNEQETAVGVWPLSERCVIEIEAEVVGKKKQDVFLYDARFPLSVGKSITLYSPKTHLSFILYKIETAAV